MYKDILNAIIPIPKPLPSLSHIPHKGFQQSYGEMSAYQEIPARGWQEFACVYCKEHKTYELVPFGNFCDGSWHYWYDAGLHPRWSIWNEIRARWPSFAMSWMWTLTYGTRSRVWIDPEIRKKMIEHSPMITFLREYKDDPARFVSELHIAWHDRYEMVGLKTSGQTWRVNRLFKARFKAHDFTVDDWKNETNQTQRRLILASRSFDVREILTTLTKLSEDDEGEMYVDGLVTSEGMTGQLYLHVKCPTTAEHYLLGIIPKFHCSIHPDFQWTTTAVTFQCPPHDGQTTRTWNNKGCAPQLSIWKPSDARRWTFGLPADAEFLQEA